MLSGSDSAQDARLITELIWKELTDFQTTTLEQIVKTVNVARLASCGLSRGTTRTADTDKWNEWFGSAA